MSNQGAFTNASFSIGSKRPDGVVAQPGLDEAVTLAADHHFAAIGERFRQDAGVAALVHDLARAQVASHRADPDGVDHLRREAKAAAERLAAAIPDVAPTTPGFGPGWQGAISERTDT